MYCGGNADPPQILGGFSCAASSGMSGVGVPRNTATSYGGMYTPYVRRWPVVCGYMYVGTPPCKMLTLCIYSLSYREGSLSACIYIGAPPLPSL